MTSNIATVTDQDWFDLVCKSQHQEVIFNGSKMPQFPDEALQISTTGSSGEQTLKKAFDFYQVCKEKFSSMDIPLSSQSKLLDFGAGWGRIARFFIREVPLDKIYGLDVQQQFVDLCNNTFDNNNFAKSAPFPPSSLSDSQFSHIVGYSVFSHLSEKACRAWIEEFYRLLQPGGVIAMTTRAKVFLSYCESLKTQNPSGYAKALSCLFPDFAQAKTAYDQGKFLHSNSHDLTGGGELTGDFYGETFIPHKYAAEAYSDLFELHEFYLSQSDPIAIIFLKSKK
ncbi:class I SAM-dependent methyltransferase [Pleurocapsa sp. PCC 7319]|uniref:class I SAM-dependent methyltransferase n=1 Tax=Pleurocapsa sp. PCC 7319 TaxID=118161 RepID=UPI0003450C25|nr:class I SAM-dependent methyltransferase [Pleurocapsa sp. PCC 7319]